MKIFYYIGQAIGIILMAALITATVTYVAMVVIGLFVPLA